jgi:hypothetical protein
MTDRDHYLIWSNEHNAWWGPDQAGYVRQLSRAGRYSRAEALDICASAIPGTAHHMKQFPEIPVRLADVHSFVADHERRFPKTGEPWE